MSRFVLGFQGASSKKKNYHLNMPSTISRSVKGKGNGQFIINNTLNPNYQLAYLDNKFTIKVNDNDKKSSSMQVEWGWKPNGLGRTKPYFQQEQFIKKNYLRKDEEVDMKELIEHKRNLSRSVSQHYDMSKEKQQRVLSQYKLESKKLDRTILESIEEFEKVKSGLARVKEERERVVEERRGKGNGKILELLKLQTGELRELFRREQRVRHLNRTKLPMDFFHE